MINSLTINKDFQTVNQYSHIKSIDSNHLKNSFFVVTDDEDNYKGLFSKVDLMLKPHFIVGDCISKRPEIANDASLEHILNVFNENRYDEYSVFEKGIFKGVITKFKLIDYLKSNAIHKEVLPTNTNALVSAINYEELNNLKIKLFSIISHDLVDPFNALLGYSSYVLDNFKEIDHEELKKHIVSIHKSANKNYQLTKQLLNWSLKQQNGFILIKNTTNVAEMLDEVIDNLYASFLQKNITIITNCDQFILFELDKDLISKVIHNLLANAIKFSAKDALIVVNVALINHQLNIEVVDRGKGINEKDLVSLNKQNSANNLNIFKFEENRQGGFGLFYSKELMDLHQGRLIFNSVLNEGTRARIELVS